MNVQNTKLQLKHQFVHEIYVNVKAFKAKMICFILKTNFGRHIRSFPHTETGRRSTWGEIQDTTGRSAQRTLQPILRF